MLGLPAEEQIAFEGSAAGRTLGLVEATRWVGQRDANLVPHATTVADLVVKRPRGVPRSK
jgi:hypothetical protein